jgi:hypothetical protein
MEKCNKNKEIKLWISSGKETREFLFQQIYGEEVLTFNKYHLLLTMIYLLIDNCIFIELDVVEDLDGKELLLILLKIKI